MLSNLFLYIANRATKGAVENVTRRASWGGIAIFLLLTGTIFALLVGFWALESRYGAMTAGGLIAVGCFVVGLLCLSVPPFLDWMERPAPKPAADPVMETVAAVQQEAVEAVDYFGPIRVVGSAFLLGLGIARRIRQS
jgi:hypothetical protein